MAERVGEYHEDDLIEAANGDGFVNCHFYNCEFAQRRLVHFLDCTFGWSKLFLFEHPTGRVMNLSPGSTVKRCLIETNMEQV